MGICSYCDQDKKLTREELFPKSLSRRSPGYGTYIDHHRPARPLRAVPVVRDVCAQCNNERLGALDSYADKLTGQYFGLLAPSLIDVSFRCDTNQLLRWLLKLLFNDARTRGAPIDIYRKLRPFILGVEPNPKFPLNLLLGIIAPVLANDTAKHLYPEHHVFADIRVGSALKGYLSLCRAVFLNSYLFVILVWQEKTPRPTRWELVRKLAAVNSLVELSRPTCAVKINRPCTDTMALVHGTFVGEFSLAAGPPDSDTPCP
jgi:hypothetical protein